MGLRGGGCSYGDAALNDGGLLLDLCGMDRILEFDPGSGRLRAQGGVTIEQVWRRALPHGWWPPVVPGTMYTTLGGSAAMNIHGKNNFRAGAFGEHIRSLDLLLADGSTRRCTPQQEPELFHAAIGGFGMLGVITALTLDLKRVHSGDLAVTPLAAESLEEMVGIFEERQGDADYLVGWVDAFPGGSRSGRGLVHAARHLRPGEDPDPGSTLTLEHQALPERFFGVVPGHLLKYGLWCFLHRPGMRLINAMKHRAGRRDAGHGTRRQSLVAFSFLLDHVPGWKLAYRPGGLIQYQVFAPREATPGVLQEVLALARRHGIPPYIGVLKRHRPDPFLMTHALDGYSLALDFPCGRNRRRLLALVREMDAAVIAAGGRFYFAKDSTMTPEVLRRTYPGDRVARFLDLKRRVDPEGLLQNDLFRRVFGPLEDSTGACA